MTAIGGHKKVPPTVSYKISYCQTYLCQKISKEPSNKGGTCLCGKWGLVKSFIVCSPSWNSSASGQSSIAEKWTGGSWSLLSQRVVVYNSIAANFLSEGTWRDSECLSGKAGCSNEDGSKLHCSNFFSFKEGAKKIYYRICYRQLSEVD